MNISELLIKKIEEIKMSTEEISDILGKTGVVKKVYPALEGSYCVGEIQYFCTFNNSNWPLHEQLVGLTEGKICFADTCFVDDYAVFGELVSSFIINNKKAKGIIVNGLVRDISGIKKRGFKVWCKGVTPIGCFNVRTNENPEINRYIENNRAYYEGAIAVCDDSGVVVISKEKITKNFVDTIDAMHKQEKIWFDCVENKSWTTYDTVCLKKYLEDSK